MSFRDYSTTPGSNLNLSDGTFIGPNMARTDVREALQTLAANGKELTDEIDESATSYLRVPAAETFAELPNAAARANKLLQFSSNGLSPVMFDPSSLNGEDAPLPNWTLATGAAGTSVQVSGTYPNQTITIPRGDPGLSGALANGTYSGIVVTGSGANLDVVPGHITLARMANLAANSFIGNNTGSPATPIALTAAQAKTLLSIGQADVTNLVSDLALKAPLASPAFTGNPTVPTQSSSDNSTRAASTAFVKAQSYVTSAAPALTGNATIDGETIGFRHLPVVTKSSSFVFALADDGKGHLYDGSTGTATINPVGTTAYPDGYTIVGWNSGAGNLTLTRGSGVSLFKNGSSTSADVVVGSKGRFTLIHWVADFWTVDGTNLT